MVFGSYAMSDLLKSVRTSVTRAILYRFLFRLQLISSLSIPFLFCIRHPTVNVQRNLEFIKLRVNQFLKHCGYKFARSPDLNRHVMGEKIMNTILHFRHVDPKHCFQNDHVTKLKKLIDLTEILIVFNMNQEAQRSEWNN